MRWTRPRSAWLMAVKNIRHNPSGWRTTDPVHSARSSQAGKSECTSASGFSSQVRRSLDVACPIDAR